MNPYFLMFNYQPLTTAWSDLSIADRFGEKGVKETYSMLFLNLNSNYKELTELVMCLNHKIWQHHENNRKLAELYNQLWRMAEKKFWELYENDNEACQYFLATTD